MSSIKFTHKKQSITTISDLVASKYFSGLGITVGEFVGTVDGSGITNIERIYARYNASDFDNDSSFLDNVNKDIATVRQINQFSSFPLLPNTSVTPIITESPLKSFTPIYNKLMLGTELVVNLADIHNNMNIPDLTADRFYNSEPFMDEVIKALMGDDDFVDTVGLDDQDFGLTDRNPQATVWVWTKSLGTDGHLSGKLLNLSPFLKSVNTSKQKISGSFIINLAYAFDKQTVPDAPSVFDYTINSVDSKGKRRRNISQFHSMLSRNDLVFIRLSRLKLEKAVPEMVNLDDIQPSDISGRVYDMIGLIDNVTDNTEGASGGVSVTITGQDFTKLLSDDGSSIYQVRYTSAGSKFEELELSNEVFRVFGKAVSMFQLTDSSIDKQMQYVIDYMTRSVICEGLFDAYPIAKRRIDKILIPDGSTINAKPVSGIWQIISVAVDKAIAGYNAFNARLGNDYNSILAQLSSICHEPFVELYTDTYGDQFKIMARKPIFDRESVIAHSKSPILQTVHEFDILSDSLDYDSAAFSWYRVSPRYISSGIDKEDFKWLLPAKYFQEYADIFGDKPLQVENPYIRYEMAQTNSKSTVLLAKNQIVAHIQDYKYVIETHAYLPFTRRGTISINGKRTYKRGTWFYNEGTDEMFYIDSVSHNLVFSGAGTDYVTTLNVSRGMKRSILEKYFQIVKMPIQDFTGDNVQAFLEGTLVSWLVDTDVFDYFISRKQLKKLDPSNSDIVNTNFNEVG